MTNIYDKLRDTISSSQNHCADDRKRIYSPNIGIRPVSARINRLGHLEVGGCDTTELAERFGTPLYVIDERTIEQAVTAFNSGLRDYPSTRVLFAGKAFTCLAMYRLVHQLGLGVDVVSEGELYTACKAGLPAQITYLHGNNKSAGEIMAALEYDANLVVDNIMELRMIAVLAGKQGRKARVLLRVVPGVEPDTHKYIKTGQVGSKFGFALDSAIEAARVIRENEQLFEFQGLHAHIGSFCKDVSPYLQLVDILSAFAKRLKDELELDVSQVNVGGGLGCTLTENDKPMPISQWCSSIAARTRVAFGDNNMKLPLLLLEPGRSIIGTAGITLYRVGSIKTFVGHKKCVAVDGGMADNPRPITYQAKYSACVANRMNAPVSTESVTLVGKYCESGDVLMDEARLQVEPNDLIAVFGTGAYNYSMSSNYNRTGRPACILVADGLADIIIERESNQDLLRNDRVPPRLAL